MNYINSPFDNPTKLTRDLGAFASMIDNANREARQLERDKDDVFAALCEIARLWIRE